MQKKLMVKVNGEWKYVFCRNILKAEPIITESRRKALTASDIEYFQTHFGNHEFRSEGDI